MNDPLSEAIERQESEHGAWDENYYAFNCGCPQKHVWKSFWATVIESPQWKAWEREVHRRLHEYNKSENVEALKGVWDVDECRECGWISAEHFQDFLAFVVDQAARKDGR